MRVPFLNPFGAARLLQLKPRRKIDFHACQKIQKCSGIAEYHPICGAIVIQFFMAAIDTDQMRFRFDKRRISEIHLIIEPPSNHQYYIRVVQRLFRGVILVKIR